MANIHETVALSGSQKSCEGRERISGDVGLVLVAAAMQAKGPGSSPRLLDSLLCTIPDVTVDFPPGFIFQMHATSRHLKDLASLVDSDTRDVLVAHVADEGLFTLRKEREDRKKTM